MNEFPDSVNMKKVEELVTW